MVSQPDSLKQVLSKGDNNKRREYKIWSLITLKKLIILQNSELLMKSEGLMEVDAYNLTQTAYLTSDDGNSYRGIEEQLNINDIGKVENEYLLTEAMDFGGAETNLLQTNLEAFTSQVMDTSGFLLYDKTRLRPVKKNATVNLGLDYCKCLC